MSPLQQGKEERRKDCVDHDEAIKRINADMDAINENVNTNSGRFAAMLWFMGIVGAIGMVGITVVISMLLNIQTSINANNVASAEDRKDIKTIREIEIPQIKKEVTAIEDRHKWEDQNGQSGRSR